MRWPLLALLSVASCSYPEFAFQAGDASSCTTSGTSRELAVGLYGDAGSGYPAFSARLDDVSLDWL